DCYVAALDVKAGEHYVIMIDDWSGKNTTFKLTWTFKNGAALECKEDEEPPTEPEVAMDTSIIEDLPVPPEVITEINPTYLEAGGDAEAVDLENIPQLEATLSEEQQVVTLK